MAIPRITRTIHAHRRGRDPNTAPKSIAELAHECPAVRESVLVHGVLHHQRYDNMPEHEACMWLIQLQAEQILALREELFRATARGRQFEYVPLQSPAACNCDYEAVDPAKANQVREWMMHRAQEEKAAEPPPYAGNPFDRDAKRTPLE